MAEAVFPPIRGGDNVDPLYEGWTESGSTLRTHLAGQMLAAILASAEASWQKGDWDKLRPNQRGLAHAARCAVAAADALIVELNKTTQTCNLCNAPNHEGGQVHAACAAAENLSLEEQAEFMAEQRAATSEGGAS